MTDIRVTPASRPLDADISLPGSRSITNRALVLASLADGVSTLTNVLLADDSLRMMAAVNALGIGITTDEATRTTRIDGAGGHIPADHADIDCAHAGTVLRFGTALCALGFGEYRLDGSPRLRERPIAGLVDALRRLGARIEYEHVEGHAPLRVHARGLRGGEIAFEDLPSSQFLSALLLVAPAARNDILIDVRGALPSRPYVLMTLALMRRFGVEAVHSDFRRFIVPAPQPCRPAHYAVEPDASTASYFLAAPCIAGGRVRVRGLSRDSIQGDARFPDVLAQMGAAVTWEPDAVTVAHDPAQPLKGIDVDLNDMPDMVQTLAAVALFASGPTTIRNVANLTLKETDRLAALEAELSRLGARVTRFSDGLRIEPPSRPHAATLESWGDHRMAMSLALVGLAVPGITIRDADCVAKTFPQYFRVLDDIITGGSPGTGEPPGGT